MKVFLAKFERDFDPEKNINDIIHSEKFGKIDLTEKQLHAVTEHLEKLKAEGKLTEETIGSLNTEFQTLATTGLASTAKSMIKNIGLNLAFSAGVMGASAVIGILFKQLHEVTKKQQKIIDAGHKATEEIKSQRSAYQSNAEWIQKNSERYEELSKGVNSLTGENISLTTTEFEEFHHISEQIAEMFPELVSGYDSLGNAILSCAGDQDLLNQSLINQRKELANTAKGNELDILKTYQEIMSDTTRFGGEAQAGAKNALIENITDSKGVMKDLISVKDGLTQSDKKTVKDFFSSAGINTKHKTANTLIANLTEEDYKKLQKSLVVYSNNVNQELESNAQMIRQNFIDQLYGTDNYNELEAPAQNILSSIVNSLSVDNIEKRLSNSNFTISDWVNSLFKGKNTQELNSALTEISAIRFDNITKNTLGYFSQQVDELGGLLGFDPKELGEFKLKIGLDEKQLNASYKKAQDKLETQFGKDSRIGSWLNKLSTSELEIIANLEIENGSSLEDVQQQIEKIKEESTVTLNIETNSKNLQAVRTALSEAYSPETSRDTSVTGLSSGRMNELIDIFGDDAYEVFERTALGIGVNEKALGELQARQEELTKLKFEEKLKSEQDALNEQKKVLNDLGITLEQVFAQQKNGLNPDEWTKALGAANQIEFLSEQIEKTQLLATEYKGLTNAYTDWIDAQQSPNAGSKYDKVAGGYEQFEDLYKRGLLGTDDFQSFLQLMSNNDISAMDTAGLEAEYASKLPNFKKYFTESAEGCKAFLDEYSQVEKLANGKTKYSFDGTDEDLANRMGISVEAIHLLVEKLKDYNFDIEIDYVNNDDSLLAIKEKVKEAKNELSQKTEIDFNYDVTQIDDVNALKQKWKELNDYKLSIDGTESKEELENVDTLLQEIQIRIEQINNGLILPPPNSTEEYDLAIAKVEEYRTKLKDFQSLLNEKSQGKIVDEQTLLSSRKELENIVKLLGNMSEDTLVKIGFDKSSLDLKGIQKQLNDPEFKLFQKTLEEDSNKKVESEIVVKGTDKANKQIKSVTDNLSKIKDKKSTITTTHVEKYVTEKSEPAKKTFVEKVKGLFGASNAKGTDGPLKTGEKNTLVGELGPEILARDGKWYTVGENGPEIIGDLKPGDIVFNHEQTKDLLKKGSTKQRGKSYASGTPIKGSGMFGGGARTNPSYVSDLNKSADRHAKHVSDGIKKAGSKVSSALDKLSNFFDWVAIKIDRMNRATQRAVKEIELSIGLSNKQSANSSAISAVQQELLANQKAYETYMAHANSIANKFNLSSDLINKIKNGSYNITEYDEDTNKKIAEYQKWYDAAIKCQDAVAELKLQEQELAVSRLKNIEEYYQAIEDLYSAQGEVSNSNNDWINANGYSATSDTVKDNVKDNLKYQEQIFKNLSQELSDYQNEFNKLVEQGYIQEGSQAWYDAKIHLENLSKELNEADIAVQEFKEQLHQIEIKKMDIVIDSITRAIDKLSNVFSLKEGRDVTVTEEEYKKQIGNNNSKIDELYKKRQYILNESDMKLWDVNSEKYQEYAKQIADIDSEILNLSKDNDALKASIREVRWKEFNDGVDSVKKLTAETSDLRGLLHSDAFLDKKGGLTDDGLAYISLTAQQMNSEKQLIADYTEGLKRLDEELANGVISTEKYKEEQDKFLSSIRDSVGNVENYKNELIDLYRKQMEAETDALDKSIQKRKEAYLQKVEYYEYDKKIRSQQKDVNVIKAEIQALQGVNNAYSQAELKRLQADLAEREESLNETKRAHEQEIVGAGFDDLSEDIKKNLEDTLYEVTHNADKQQEVVNNMLNNIVNAYGTAYGKIQEIIKDTGFVTSGTLGNNITDLGTSSGSSSQVDKATTPQSNISSGKVPQNVDTSTINGDKHYTDIENEISKEIDTKHRKVAALSISPASISMDIGKRATISYSVRPTDAENTSVSWSSSNSSVASISSGIVVANNPGTATITCSTTDGSNISKTCTITVKEPPKPPTPKPQPQPQPQPNTSHGTADGVPRIGDPVTFTSGRYYYDSYGKRPVGSKYRGSQVYITNINHRGSKPYHISRRPYLGGGDLGWLSLSQIKGYKTGIDNVPYSQLAKIDEAGKELIYRYGGNNYSLLTKGSTVFKAEPTKNLTAFGENPQKFLMKQLENTNALKNVTQLNINFDSLMNINTVTQESVPDLKKLVPDLANEVSKRIYKEIRKNL